MVEQLGPAVAPGPFVPTVIASAVLRAVGGDAAADAPARPRRRLGHRGGRPRRRGDGHRRHGLGRGRQRARRRAGPRCCSSRPVTTSPSSRSATASPSTPRRTSTRPAARPGHPRRRARRRVLPGARQALVDLARVILSAEAVGMARECTEMAAAYAKERIQFGRPIAMFQAVKHHCANMVVATELATSAVWDAARAASTGGDQLTYTAAVAATLAGAGGRPVRQPQHPGARRHRHHLGARRPPLHAPGHRRCSATSSPTWRPPSSPTSPAGGHPGQGRRAARPRPRPSATRCGPSPSASRACRPRSSAPSSSRPAT